MDMTVILVTAGAGIIIGLLIGLMINALRGDSSKGAAPSESTARGIDNILLWHDKEGGNLIVDLDGSTFLRVNEMRADQRSRLETIYSQLKRFMGVQDTTPRPAVATPVAAQIERPTQAPFTDLFTQPVPSQTVAAQTAPVQSTPIRPVPSTPVAVTVSPETVVIPPSTEDQERWEKTTPSTDKTTEYRERDR